MDNIKKTLVMILVGALTLSTLSSFSSCNFYGDTESDEFDEPVYESPYTWDNLIHEEGRFYYYKDDALVSRTGIDVSSHQHEIDWQAVAADGVEFALIRAGYRGSTEGLVYLDEHYYTNIEGAQNAGLMVGVYFFSQALTEEEAVEEAEFLLTHLEGRELEYPVVYDFEPVTTEVPGRANDISQEQATRNAQAFCDCIEAAGYTTMLYGNKKDIARYYDPSLVEVSEVWVAEYGALFPSGQFDFSMWQYSSTAQVAGISVNVDMNIHFLEP